MDRIKYFLILGLTGLGLFGPSSAAAQTPQPSIHLVTSQGLVQTGDILTAEIQLNSGGQNVNAVEVVLQYAPQQLQVVSVTRQQSVLTLWPEVPRWDAQLGEVHMTGGRPGGFYAVNASLATVYFRALTSGPVQLGFDLDQTAAYLHDGKGTRLPLESSETEIQVGSNLQPRLELISTTHPTPEYWSHGTSVHVGWVVEPDTEYSYEFSTDPSVLPDATPEKKVGSVEYTGLTDGVYFFTIKQRAIGQPWSALIQRRFLIDGTPPASFTIQRVSSGLANRATWLIWNTTDQTSGLVGYRLAVDGRDVGAVSSPLNFDDAWRGHRLTITATDAAGNIRTATWQKSEAGGYHPLVQWWIILILGVGALVVAVWVTRRLIASR